MTNPYAPPPSVALEDRKFRLATSVRSSTSFMKVGLVCAFISGVILEITVANYPSIESVWAMVLPGFVLGLGVFCATKRNVPHARPVGLILFPFIALASFALIGMMFDSKVRVTFATSAMEFSIASFPGVLMLAVGCLIIARPRSYSRFVAFIAVTTMVCGVGALLAYNPPTVLAVLPRYLLIMMFAQGVMFGMVGWIFGDTISESAIRQAPTSQDATTREA